MKLNVREKSTASAFNEILGLVVLIVMSLFMYYVLTESAGSDDDQPANRFLSVAIIVVMLIASVISSTKAGMAIFLNRSLKKRRERLQGAAEKNGMQYELLSHSDTNIMSPTILDLGDRDRRIRNRVTDGSHEFFDYSYAIYKKKKRGEYKARTVHYAVCQTKLSRELPNVFFDSSRSGGTEFRFMFSQDQRHSLEGDFDSYFDTYFATDYHIDSLSFITPEVMQALITAREYDVEIYRDNLYLYSELRNMPGQLNDMFSFAENIRSHLADNIDTYRDERIDYADGRSRVSVSGIRLRRSLIKEYMTIGLALVALMSLPFVSMYTDIDGMVLAFVSVFVLIHAITAGKKILKSRG